MEPKQEVDQDAQSPTLEQPKQEVDQDVQSPTWSELEREEVERAWQMPEVKQDVGQEVDQEQLVDQEVDQVEQEVKQEENDEAVASCGVWEHIICMSIDVSFDMLSFYV